VTFAELWKRLRSVDAVCRVVEYGVGGVEVVWVIYGREDEGFGGLRMNTQGHIGNDPSFTWHKHRNRNTA
jgi:hypothetical protein